MNRTSRTTPSSVRARATARGFTLVELMITLVVLALVVVVVTAVLFTAQRGKTTSANNIEASQSARVALDLLARDLRSAGYGADRDYIAQPQPPIAYIDSLQVLINANIAPYPDTLSAGKGSPLAYAPTGNPKPFPLNASTWSPPIRYRTGAEVVRWTLDVNNDGAVDAGDINDANGADARRTPNPVDYELVRQVYGDSTNLSAGNNGGNTERVALVLPPGGAVPPMFQVYLGGSSTPWNWSSGPVPASELRNITRITVQVTAASAKPDWRGAYARTTFRTDVSSMRNVPNFGVTEYAVDGYVFNDLEPNGVKSGSDTGIAGATVMLGNLSTTTGASGYFLFQIPAGTYTLRHTPPSGYGVYTSPDSFVVTVGPGTSRSFADTARSGGTVDVLVYDDLDSDGSQDPGEVGKRLVKVTLTPGAVIAWTDTSGRASLFAPVGGWSVACTAPDSFSVTTTNPVTGTMVNGGTGSATFGVARAPVGSIKGTVYRDANNNGNKDGSEVGIENVWVGVTDDGGTNILGFAYTNADGDYEIDNIPINDPPQTTPYTVYVIPPTGFYPTTSSAIGSLWLQSGQTLSGKNFGLNSFQRIKLDATRVLCLGSRDLVEKDWNGNQTQNRRIDQDLVLGADAGGTDQVSVWFNPYSNSFSGTPSYTRTAPNAVLAMALDTLETATTFRRPDLVTGTKYTASGNFFVWLIQNSNNNEGYFPTAYTAGMNYKTQDNGDVTAVLTNDCAGGAGADMPDIIVGTRSPTAGLGSIEVWKNNNASPTPAFTPEETYTVSGTLGEVTSMALADFDNDGRKDLVVATRKTDYTGQVMFFRHVSKSASPHFQLMSSWFFGGDIPSAVGAVDVDQDGNLDVVIGTQSGTASGALYYLRNAVPAALTFAYVRRVDAPGIVQAITVADFGGGAGQDVAIGYRSNTSSYAGGVRIYFLDLLNLPNNGVDPSAGFVTNWAPALSPNNYNYGVQPSQPPPPYLTDLAAGVKIDASTGALWIFIR